MKYLPLDLSNQQSIDNNNSFVEFAGRVCEQRVDSHIGNNSAFLWVLTVIHVSLTYSFIRIIQASFGDEKKLSLFLDVTSLIPMKQMQISCRNFSGRMKKTSPVFLFHIPLYR